MHLFEFSIDLSIKRSQLFPYAILYLLPSPNRILKYFMNRSYMLFLAIYVVHVVCYAAHVDTAS